MKYADCPTTEVEVTIDGPLDAVWSFVSDIELPIRFSSEVQSVEWLDGATTPVEGARFVGTNRHSAIGDWQADCTITAVEPGRVFEWTVGEIEEPSAIWRFSLDGSDGAVTLRQWFQMGPGRSGLSHAIDAMPDKEERIVERRMAEHRANMAANLDGVKQMIEEGRA